MNRAIDDPDEVAQDVIGGVVLAQPDLLAATDHPRALRRADLDAGEARVGIVAGGGSGHEPAGLGCVGPDERGTPDAGAASCALSPTVVADGLLTRLEPST